MPGSGKSTLARALATALDYQFIDLDEVIEEREGYPVRDIFKDKGEEYFRNVEALSLREVVSSEDAFVMACGGGAPCFHDNMNLIRQSGLSIFLDVAVEVLAARLQESADGTRPLLANLNTDLQTYLTTTLEKRSKYYRMADYTSGEDEEIADLIARIEIHPGA